MQSTLDKFRSTLNKPNQPTEKAQQEPKGDTPGPKEVKQRGKPSQRNKGGAQIK
jgi:hypothetical protein